MVPHVPLWLTQFFGNLSQCISLEEVQPQGLSLVLGQRLDQLVKTITPEHRFRGIIVFDGRYSDHPTRQLLRFHARIEMARSQIPAPLYRALIQHLNDPGTCRTLRAIEDAALPGDKQKQVLDK